MSKKVAPDRKRISPGKMVLPLPDYDKKVLRKLHRYFYVELMIRHLAVEAVGNSLRVLRIAPERERGTKWQTGCSSCLHEFSYYR